MNTSKGKHNERHCVSEYFRDVRICNAILQRILPKKTYKKYYRDIYAEFFHRPEVAGKGTDSRRWYFRNVFCTLGWIVIATARRAVVIVEILRRLLSLAE